MAKKTEKNELVPGDIVYLRSGGPMMTIIEEDEDSETSLGPTFRCCWFQPDGLGVKTEKFSAYLLQKHIPEQK